MDVLVVVVVVVVVDGCVRGTVGLRGFQGAFWLARSTACSGNRERHRVENEGGLTVEEHGACVQKGRRELFMNTRETLRSRHPESGWLDTGIRQNTTLWGNSSEEGCGPGDCAELRTAEKERGNKHAWSTKKVLGMRGRLGLRADTLLLSIYPGS